MSFLYEAFLGVWGLVINQESKFMDRMAGLIILCATVLTFYAGSALVYTALNSSFIKKVITAEQVMVHRNFIPAHDRHWLMWVGKVLVPQKTHVPDQYLLCFSFEGMVVCGDVTKEMYTTAEEGKTYRVGYGFNRIDGQPVIKSIQ